MLERHGFEVMLLKTESRINTLWLKTLYTNPSFIGSETYWMLLKISPQFNRKATIYLTIPDNDN